MKKSERKLHTVLKIAPSDRPYAKIFLEEKRNGEKDRRKVHTYILNDRRSGIADKRKR